MALFRKAGNVLGRVVSNQISSSKPKPSIFQAIRCMSPSKLFIGGLSNRTDEASLKEAFSKYGQVDEARVIVDRESGRSRGFAFVTFSSFDEAAAAVEAMNQQVLHGSTIRVDYANDRVRDGDGDGVGGGFIGGAVKYGGSLSSSSSSNPVDGSHQSGGESCGSDDGGDIGGDCGGGGGDCGGF